MIPNSQLNGTVFVTNSIDLAKFWNLNRTFYEYQKRVHINRN